tara:strand:- start:3900 stop:5762 length:1863 start_codon:yes stop_codon:yes gene_type:complete
MNKSFIYRAEIDGLRAIAVFSVIFFHLDLNFFRGGYIGVDIFFVISGYLITSLILNELNNGNFKITNFYERRIRRIIPVLFFVIIVSIFSFIFILQPYELISFGKSLISNIFFFSNILFWREGGYFDIVNGIKPLFHTWSLGVEEQFYLFFPLFLVIFWKFGLQNIIVTLIIFFLISFFSSEYLVKIKPEFSFYMLPTRGWELLSGCLSAFYLQNKKNINNKLWINNILSILGLLIISLSIFFYDETTPTPSRYILLPVLGTVLIIIFGNKNSSIKDLLSNRILVNIGLMSFSLYLWHQPLIVFAKILSFPKNNFFYLSFFIILFLISFLSWKLIEKPFRKKNYISKNLLFKYCFFTGLIIFLIGLIIILKDGNLWKYNNFQMKLLETKEYNKNVWAKFRKKEIKNFNSKSTFKILIIGDSHAGDLINILSENDILNENYSIRSFWIPSPCLNLNVKNLNTMIQKKWIKRCQNINWYENKDLKNLIKNSTKVILASNYNYKHKELILKSYNNLKSIYGDKFIIFGQKKLMFDINDLLELNPDELKYIKILPDENSYKLNNFLKKNINNFIDPYDFICDNQNCKLFDKDNNIIIYDGFHLSPNGSLYLSNKMKKIFHYYLK